MKLTKLIISLSFLGLFFSCNVGNFSVKAPIKWIVRDTICETFGKFVEMHPPAGNIKSQFIENINISISQFPSSDIYINNVSMGLKENSLFFEDKGSGVVKINKYKVKWKHYIFKTKNSDITFEQKIYFIVDYSTIYQIVCTTKEKEMYKFQSKIDEVLNSFKIL
jgi:hypothetical protein